MRYKYSLRDDQNMLSSAKCPSVSSMSKTMVFFLTGCDVIYFDDIINVREILSGVLVYFFGAMCIWLALVE